MGFSYNRFLVLVLFLGICFRIWSIYFLQSTHSDSILQQSIAYTIAHYGKIGMLSFSNCNELPAENWRWNKRNVGWYINNCEIDEELEGHYAVVPIGYSLLLALFYLFFDPYYTPIYQLILGIFSLLFVFWVIPRLLLDYFSPWVVSWVLCLYSLYPPIAMSSTFDSKNAMAPYVFLLMLLAYRRLIKNRRIQDIIPLGVCFGALLYFRSQFVILPIILFFSTVFVTKRWRISFVSLNFTYLIGFLCLSPVIISTYIHEGKFALLEGSKGTSQLSMGYPVLIATFYPKNEYGFQFEAPFVGSMEEYKDFIQRNNISVKNSREQIEAYERFIKPKLKQVLKEDPWIFLKAFIQNIPKVLQFTSSHPGMGSCGTMTIPSALPYPTWFRPIQSWEITLWDFISRKLPLILSILALLSLPYIYKHPLMPHILAIWGYFIVAHSFMYNNADYMWAGLLIYFVLSGVFLSNFLAYLRKLAHVFHKDAL